MDVLIPITIATCAGAIIGFASKGGTTRRTNRRHIEIVADKNLNIEALETALRETRRALIDERTKHGIARTTINELQPLAAEGHKVREQRRAALAKATEANRARREAKAGNVAPITQQAA